MKTKKQLELENEVLRDNLEKSEERESYWRDMTELISLKNAQSKQANSTLSDNRVHFQCERAELITALVEISNCKDIEIIHEIARIALKNTHTVIFRNNLKNDTQQK